MFSTVDTKLINQTKEQNKTTLKEKMAHQAPFNYLNKKNLSQSWRIGKIIIV